MKNSSGKPNVTASWLIRVSVGLIFLSEGIQKFLFADTLGAGRFEKIGLPYTHIFGPTVGATEIVFGFLVAIGFKVRVTTIPLFIIICTAIVSTKVSLFTEKGLWGTLHESRTDFSMFMCLIFLFIVGSGTKSIDNYLSKRR